MIETGEKQKQFQFVSSILQSHFIEMFCHMLKYDINGKTN